MFTRRILAPRPIAHAAATLLALVFASAGANPFVTTTAASAASTGATTGATVDDDDDFAKADRFAESQFALIRREAAAGGGENLRALAALLDEPDPAAFETWMQRRYEALFREPEAAGSLAARIAAMRGSSS